MTYCDPLAGRRRRVAVHASFSHRSVDGLVAFAVPGRPSRRVAVGRKRRHRCRHDLEARSGIGPSGDVDRRPPAVPSAADRYRAGRDPARGCPVVRARFVPAAAAVTMRERDAEGLVLAAPSSSTEQVPPFDNTAVDGYAVRSRRLRRPPSRSSCRSSTRSRPARRPTVRLRPGEAIRIMTGAPMPDGADAVVMVEETDRLGDDDAVSTHQSPATVEPGAAVRRAGDDVQPGDLLFPAGTVVTPAIVGGAGEHQRERPVRSTRERRVAVLSTGDELVEDGRPLAPGQIRESNNARCSPGMLARHRLRGRRPRHRP